MVPIMTHGAFTSRHVHQAFHWIAGTTLFKRVDAGLLPYMTRGRGRGSATTFSLAQLVHIAVHHEIAELGALKDSGTSPERVKVTYSPIPENQRFFELPKEENPIQDIQLAPSFYEKHDFNCYVDVILSRKRYPDRNEVARRNRGETYFTIEFRPDYKFFEEIPWDEQYHPTPFRVDTREGVSTVTISRLEIDVYHLYSIASNNLGLFRSRELRDAWTEKVDGIVPEGEG